jgi:hypothetical protein
MQYVVEMVSYGMIYVQSSMKIGTGVLAILSVFLSNVNGCNAGITHEKK